MISTKTKTSPRFVVNGAIRLGARVFTCTELAGMEGTTVYISYDTLMDTEVDILDENMDVVATAIAVCNKKVA